MQRFLKDPDAELDYRLDWSEWLASDTISTSTWSADTGITVTTSTNTTTTATVWLAGGTLGQAYTVTNRVVTAGGRTDERSFLVVITER